MNRSGREVEAPSSVIEIDELETPALLVDLDRMTRNLDKGAEYSRRHGIGLRPHIKTHKSPLLAQMQVAAGAKGITCQKIGEAEVMAEAGIDDILISYNLIGEEKMARLGAVQGKAHMTVACDNSVVVAGLPQAAAASGRPLSVVVECDTGRKRAGVETPADPLPRINDTVGLRAGMIGGALSVITEWRARRERWVRLTRTRGMSCWGGTRTSFRRTYT